MPSQLFRCFKCDKSFKDLTTKNRHEAKCNFRGHIVIRQSFNENLAKLKEIATTAESTAGKTYNQSSHFPITDDWGTADEVGFDIGSLLPSKSKDRHHITAVNLSNIEEVERQHRLEPQREALGYDNELLRSHKSLSVKYKEIIQQDRKNKSRIRRCRTRHAVRLKRGTNRSASHTSNETINSSTLANENTPEERNELSQERAGPTSTHADEELVEELTHEEDDIYDPFGDLPWVIADEEEYDDDDDIDVEHCDTTTIEDSLRTKKGEPFSRQVDPSKRKIHRQFKYQANTLPPLYVAYIDLLNTLDHHRVDLKVFDLVIDWAIRYSTKYTGIFENAGRDNTTKRTTFINHLRTTFKREKVKPKVTDLSLPHSKRTVSVPTYDFGSQISDLLLSVDHSTIKQPNMNSITWDQIKPIEEINLIRPANAEEETGDNSLSSSNKTPSMQSPPDINSLQGKTLKFLIEFTDENGKVEINPCLGKVIKILNKKTRTVSVMWEEGDDPKHHWRMKVTFALWKSNEHVGWCLESDQWPHLDDEDNEDNEDNNKKKPPKPAPSDLLNKRVKVSCRIDIIDPVTLEDTGETKLGWYSGRIMELTANPEEFKILWCGYSNKTAQTVTLSDGLWYAGRSREGAWRVIQNDKEDDIDLLNPRTGSHDDSVPVGDLYSGSAMTQGLNEHYRNATKPDGVDLVRPLPLVLFIDKSHTDNFGALSVTPVMATIGSFPQEMREKSCNWVPLGYVPNLAVGKGKNAGKLDLKSYVLNQSRRAKGDKKIPEAMGKLIDYHHILDHIFKSFDDCARSGGLYIHHEEQNNVVLYIPFISLVIGDTSGNNELMCHHNSSGSLSGCLMTSCMCPGMKLPTTPPRCIPITRDDIERSLVDLVFAQSISQHPVRSAFHNLPMAVPDGLHYLAPKEILHVFYVGLYIACTLVLHDTVGKKKKNAKHKDYLDQLHQHVAMELRRQSERDIPRTSNRYGFMDMTRLSGRERMGNLFVCLVLFNTRQGKTFMKPFLERANICHADLVDTMELLLSYEAWISTSGHKRSYVAGSLPVVCQLANMIQKNLPKKLVKKKKTSTVGIKVEEEEEPIKSPPRKKPREEGSRKKQHGRKKHSKLSATKIENDQEGSNGWYTPKFHALFTFPNSMLRFGYGRVFDSGPGEEHHKDFIKAPGANTNRNANSFTDQLSVRNDERAIVKRAHKHVLGETIQPITTSKSTNEIRLSGTYTLFITPSEDNHHTCQTYWHDFRKRVNKDDHVLHHLLTFGIITHANNHNFNDCITVSGFTEAHFNSTNEHNEKFVVRASPSFKGSEWYDWVVLSVPESEESKQCFKRPPGVSYHCFARVLGFLSYEQSPGYPTYQYHDVMKKSTESINKEKLVDDRMYVVVECNEDRIDIDQIGDQLVFPFKMSKELNKVRIFPISVIVSPAAVVTNFKSKTSVHYLACMPRRKWGQVFNNRVRDNMSYLQNNELEDIIIDPGDELYSSSEEDSDNEEENSDQKLKSDTEGGSNDGESVNNLPEIEDTSDEESTSSQE